MSVPCRHWQAWFVGVTHPSLRIIIVNYHVPHLVAACIESLQPAMEALGSCEVVVVENSGPGSGLQDGLAANGASGLQRVRILNPGRNLGFAGGNNLAIREALCSAEVPGYLFLLNPDTIVRPGAVESLLAFMEAHPRAGIGGAWLESADGSAQGSPFRFPSLGSEIERGMQFAPVSRLLRRWSICCPKPDGAAVVDWVAGAAMMLRREMIEEIGLLDERFFTYFEDVEYCWRARRGGWSTWFVPESRIVHLEGQSSGVESSSRQFPEYWFDARRFYLVKVRGFIGATLIDVAFLASAMVGKARCALQGKPAPHDWSSLGQVLRRLLSRGREGRA